MSNLEKFITLKDLENEACEEGLNYFKTNFSNGAKVIDVIKKLEDSKTTACWIFWLCVAFKLTYEAKKWYKKRWYKNEQLLANHSYKDGKPHGLCQGWYKNGQLQYSFNYKDGKEHGLCQIWYENGQLQSSYHYKDGNAYGICLFWHENGQLWSGCDYKDGCISTQ